SSTRSIGPVLNAEVQASPRVIAHRGASGYLPEHTREAVVLAHGMNVDFIEQDVVLSRDDVPVVLHDLTLNDVTDVAVRFPDRQRADGLWYVIDFDLTELRLLQVTERRSEKGPWKDNTRFPQGIGTFRICTLSEQLELIRGLNRSRQQNVGICVELKQPQFHRDAGKDVSRATLQTLTESGWDVADGATMLQCFDAAEVLRLRTELICSLPIVQLLSKAPSSEEMQQIGRVADAIGIPVGQVVTGAAAEGQPAITDVVQRAHQSALQVFVWTVRADALPAHAPNLETYVTWLVKEGGVDGIFSDHPDLICRWRNRQTDEASARGPFRLLNQRKPDAGDN
ncbi:MAG: hypothetical protein KDA85_17360, partial [Planctomycetaceae bacterium]|nr:hypothetical protein [Planctomycetaceae bacterium]